MKSILGLVFLGMAVVMMAGCGGADEEAESTPETSSRTLNSEVTTVGLESDGCDSGCSGAECGECPAAAAKCADGEKCEKCPASGEKCEKCDGKCESKCEDCKDEKTEGDAEVSTEKVADAN